MRKKTYIENIILLCLLGMFYSAPRASIPRSRQQQQKMWVKCSNKAQFVERGEGRDRDSEKSVKARYSILRAHEEGLSPLTSHGGNPAQLPGYSNIEVPGREYSTVGYTVVQ